MKGFRVALGLLSVLPGIAVATPPQVITLGERYFGAGDRSFTVLREVNDNQGSYYENRSVTSLVERSLDDNRVLSETVLLDRETVIDATYQGPGRPPVEVIIHSKNEKESLGSLMERWPDRGRAIGKEELKRFRLHRDRITYDHRVDVSRDKAVEEALLSEDREVSDWELEEGVETVGSFFLKLSHRGEEEEGSTEAWLAIGPRLASQVRAFRDLLPVCLSPGAFATKEEALKKALEWNAALGRKPNTGFFETRVWMQESGGEEGRFVVVLTYSGDVIRSGRLADQEAKLGTRLEPVSSHRFREWIPFEGE